jgi:hypothetical protein
MDLAILTTLIGLIIRAAALPLSREFSSSSTSEKPGEPW